MSSTIANASKFHEIKRGTKLVTVESLLSYVRDEAMVLDENVQREKVQDHPSSGDSLLETMCSNMPFGNVTAYVNGIKCPDVGHRSLTETEFLRGFRPTKTTPLRLTDHAHRWRFEQDIVSGIAKIDGLSLEELRTQHPDAHSTVMNSVVSIDIAFSTNGIVPREYIAKSFRRLQLSAPLAVGENAKASLDDNLVNLANTYIAAFEPYINLSSKRGLDRAIITAMIRGTIDPSKMTTKEVDVEHGGIITDENMETIIPRMDTLKNAYADCHAQVNVDSQNATADVTNATAELRSAVDRVKTTKKAKDATGLNEANVAVQHAKDAVNAAKIALKNTEQVRARIEKLAELKILGALVFGIYKSPDTASNIIKRFIAKVCQSKETYARVAEICRDPTAARYYTATRWANTWDRICSEVGESRSPTQLNAASDIATHVA